MPQQPYIDLPDVLETPRLRLRPYCAADAGSYFEMCVRNRTHLLPYEAGNPALNVATLDDAVLLMSSFAEEWDRRIAFFLGVWEKASHLWVAQIYIGARSWELPEFEIGYFVDVAQQGKGFVTEAMQVAVEMCFTRLNAHRLRIECNELNVRSQRVAERCGFRREGHIRQTHRDILCPDGTFSGDYLYGLLRSEYQGRADGLATV